MKRKFSHLLAHYLPQCLLLISILTSNVLFPATVIAQEIENTNNVTQEETVPIDTSEDILEEGISTSIYEEEEVVEPLFVFENGIYTVKNVVQGEEYVYPDNNNVRVKFTEVTQEGNLVIKKVELTEEQKELLNTKDNYGWDITSSMENGTFKYNLTLPNTQGNDDIEVKYTEDGEVYTTIEGVVVNEDVVNIVGLDHFSIYYVGKRVLPANPVPIEAETIPTEEKCDITVPSDVESIQEAIDKSVNAEGELTICITPGVYKGQDLVIKHSVKLVALLKDPSKEEVVIIGSGSSEPTIRIAETTNVEINGLTIVESNSKYGGIFIENSTGCLIKDNKISANKVGTKLSNIGENTLVGNIFNGNQIQITTDTLDDEGILEKILSQNKFDGAIIVRSQTKSSSTVIPTIFGTIQAAVDSAGTEDVLDIYYGTYKEIVNINKSLSLVGIEEKAPTVYGGFVIKIGTSGKVSIENINFEVPDENPVDSISANGVNKLELYVTKSRFDGSGLFVSGKTRGIMSNNVESRVIVESSNFTNGYYTAIQGKYKELNIKNTIISNCKSGINFQGGSYLFVNNTDVSVVAQAKDSDTYAVRFASESANTGKDMILNGGKYVVDKKGITANPGIYHSAIIVRSGASGVLKANNLSLGGEVVNLSSNKLDAINNWWGDASGPKDTVPNDGSILNQNLNGKGYSAIGAIKYAPWYKDADMENLTSGNAITLDATDINLYDATLNGTNGSYDATGHSFWVSLSSFSTDSPNIPSNVYSTQDFGVIEANTDFSASLSSITNSGIPRNLPPITPNTTYYYVAWSLVDGTWYPGEVKSFTTLPINAPTAILTANGINVLTNGYTNSYDFRFTLSSSSNTTHYQLKYWNDITDSPFKENTPWNKTISGTIYSDHFTQGEGKHYFSFSACDVADNCSEYSEPFVVTYDKTKPTIEILEPAENSSHSGSFDVKVKGTDESSGLDKVIIHVYNSSNQIIKNCDTFQLSGVSTYTVNCEINSLNHENGNYLLKTNVYDLAGNMSDTLSRSFIFDNTNPTGEILGIKYPNGTVQDRFITNLNTPLLVGSSDDNNGMVNEKVKIGSYISTYGDAWPGFWNAGFANPIPDGTYPIVLTLTDLAGNETVVTKDITIDTLPPTAIYKHYKDGVEIDEITNPITYVKGINQLSFTARYIDTEPSSGLFQDSYVIFEAQNDGSFKFDQNGKRAFCSWRKEPNLVTGLSGATYSLTDEEEFTNCIETLPDGEYYIAHQVYDSATRKDIPSIYQFRDVLGLHFIVDSVAPKSEISIVGKLAEGGVIANNNGWHGKGWYYNFDKIFLSVDNPKLGDFIQYQIMDGDFSEPGQNWTSVGNWIDLAETINQKGNGIYTIFWYAEDLAGNTEDPKREVVKIDRTNPTYTIDFDSINGLKNNNVTYIKDNKIQIEVEVGDALSGYTRARYDLYTADENWICTHKSTNEDNLVPAENNTSRTLTVSGLSDGRYCLNIWVYDDVQNKALVDTKGEQWVHFIIDTTPPSAPTLTGDSIQYVQRGSVTRTWSPSSSPDVDYYMYKNITNGFSSGPYDAGQDEYSITHNTGNYDRIFEWKVSAVDYAGNETWSGNTHKVVVDGTKPTVNIENVSIVDKKLTFTVSGNDNLSGARIVEANIYNEANTDSAVIAIGELSNSINPQTLIVSYDAPDIDLSELESGVYTIRASITDYSGNIEYATHQIEVDNTAPTTVLNDDLSGKYINQPILIKGVSTDTNGIDSVNISYKLTGTTDWTFLTTIDNTSNDSPYDFTYEWEPTSDGTYDIKVSATDIAGNIEQDTYISSLTYDSTPPSITVFNIDSGTLNISANDLLSGTDKIQVSTGNEVWKDYTPGMNINDLIGTQPGTYTIYVKVTDKAGNPTEDSMEYTIPQPAPTQIPATTGGAVLGATTTTTTKTTTKGITKTTSPISTTQTEEILETTSIEEPSVLGERCENKKKVSGYVYIDKNKDKEMNENEEGIKDITLTIQYTDEEGNIKTEEEVNTDEKGYWETQLCSGKYNIVVKEDTLPQNIEVAEVLSLTVSDNEKETIFNIQALDTRNFWQKYWYLIVGGLAIIVIGYISIKNRKKEEI